MMKIIQLLKRGKTALRPNLQRFLAALLPLTLVLALAAACAPVETPTGSYDSSQSTGESSVTGSGTSVANGEGGTVIVGVTQEPDFLDPYLAEAAGTKEIFYNVFEGLLRLEPDGSYTPLLATAYRVADDGLAYEFDLREGVRFHNGAEMTVADAIFSLKRGAGLLDGTAYIPQFDIIKDVTADGQTITVSLERRDMDLLGFFTNAIIPESYEDQGTKPVGTGPFTFAEYVPQQRITLDANEDYWQEGIPHLDSVEFRILPSADAAFVDLQAGRIDVFPYLTADKGEQLKDDFNLIEAESNLVQLWALNNKVEPFNDVRVRRALNLAVDKEAVIDFVMSGYGRAIHAGMSPAMGEYYNDQLEGEDGAPVDTANVERAKELLAEAGYPDGFELTITVPSNYVIHVQTGEVIVSQLADVGITAKLEPVDWGTWLERVYTGRDYQTTIIALTFVYTPSDVLGRYRSDNADNFINFDSADYDRVWTEMEGLSDHEERVAAYHELQQILYEEAASVFLQDPTTITAVKKELEGYTIYPQYVQDMAPIRFRD